MATNRKSPSFVLLLLVGAFLLTSATLGHGSIIRADEIIIKAITSEDYDESSNDNDISTDTGDSNSEDLNAQPAYGLQSHDAANPRCSLSCSNANRKFNYAIGTTYQYLYEGDLRTFITKNEFTGVKLTANVDIEVVSACDFVLKLSQVTLRDYDPENGNRPEIPPSANQIKNSLEAQPLSFSFDDGTIDSICPSKDEESWVLNIKRAILSQFQSTMPSKRGSTTVKETDVSGTCETAYNYASGRITRIKDLNKCKGRHLGQTALQGIQYQTKMGLQSMPILKAIQECKQQIDNSRQIIQQVECTEQFSFTPLEGKVSGASTTVNTKLVYQSSFRQDQTTDFSRIDQIRSTLVFDHRFSAHEVAEFNRDAHETLRVLQQESDVTQNTPQLFNKLTKQMKKLDAEKLHRIVSAARTDRAKSFVYDALPLLETAASIKVMRELFGSLDDKRREIWISSLAFIQEPTKEMLDEAKHFLDLDFDKSALTVSSLAHNYLKSDGNNRDISPILQALFEKLRPNCQATGPEEFKTLKVLKAIGNIGKSKDAASGLMSCAMNKEASMAIRVAAVDAFRRQDCLPENLKFLDTTLADIELDSELRITAYLQRAKCFDRDFFVYIRDVLEKEKINQVGSFIWTHLTNLAKSGSPLKSDVAKLLRDVKSFRQFDLDERKFSRNDEWSYFDETGNYGATAESNLIWSQSSFVPRSASLNLTVDLFGQSVNLLEFGTRVQGVEGILENLFREKKSRSASESPNGEDAFDSRFTKKADETSLDFYVRVFGNELITEQLNPGSVDIPEMVRRVNFMDFLTMLAQERQMEFTRSYKILDISFCLPTQIGLPMRLSVEGTATVALIARGKFDILHMMSSLPSLDIGGQFKPSSAVVISGEMGVDFRHIKQGIRVVSTVHSKAVFDGKIQLKNGNAFNLDINMPEERIDLFSMESKFYVVNRGERIEKINANLKTQSDIDCLEDGIVPILGVKVCLDYSYVDFETLRELDVTSFTPISLRFYIAKADTHTGYHLSSSFISSSVDPTDVFTFELDTPHSRVNRKISVNFQLHRLAKRITAELRSPWKILALDTGLMLEQDLWKVESSLVVDERDTYRANAELKRQQTGELVHYTYKSGLQRPTRPSITMDGHLKYNDHRIEGKANLTNVFLKPVAASFSLDNHKNANKYQLTASLISQPITFTIKSTLSNFQPSSMTMMVKTDVNYKYEGGQKQTIATEFKIKDKSTRNLKSIESSGLITLTEYPHLNLNGVYNIEYSATSLRQKLELGRDDQNKLIIDQSGILDLYQGLGQRLQGSLQVQVPRNNVNYKVNFDYKRSDSELTVDTYVSSHDQKQAFGILNVKNSVRGPMDMAIKTELNALGYGIKIGTNLKETALMSYSGSAKGELLTPRFRKSIEAEADYKIVDGSRHEWHIKTALEGFNPVEFSGHINPNLKNLQVKGAVFYSGDIYSAGFDYLHRGTGDTNFNCKFDVKVAYPGAEHQLEVKMTRRDMEFGAEGHLKLTTSREVSRRLVQQNFEYKLSGQIVVHPYTPAFLVRVEWGENFIQLNAGGKYETSGWLTATEDLKGEIAFKSSITGAEEFLINFQLDLDRELTLSTATLTWAPNRKITADFSMDDSKIQLNFTTPFENYRSIRLQTLTTMQSTQARPFSHTTRLIWDSKFVSFAIHCNTTRLANFNGKATITTAFEGFESISLALKNRLKGNDYHGSAELTLPKNEKMLLLLESKNAISRGQVSFEGRVVVKRPFTSQRSDNNHLNWNYKQNSTTINSLVELDVFGLKYSAQLTGQSRLTKARVINGKLEIKTPHSGIMNFGAEFEHHHNISGIDTSQRLSMNLEEQSMTLLHKLQYAPRNILVYGIKVNTPFRNFENLEIRLDNNIQGSSTLTKTIVDLGPVGRGMLEGRFENKNNGEFSGKYELETSSQSFKKAIIEIENNRVDGKWKTSCDVKVNDMVVMSTETRLVFIGREKVFELDLITPLENLRVVKLTFSSVGSAKNLSISAGLEHNQLSDRISASFSYDIRDLKKILFFARLTTPFSNYERITFKASKSGTWEKFNSGLDIEINNKRLESTTAFEVRPNNFIKLTKTLELPFEIFHFLRSASFDMQHTGYLTDFVNVVSLRVTDHGGFTSTLSSEFKAAEPSGKITVTTPKDSLRSLILQFNHQSKNTVHGDGWTNEASIELYGKSPITFKSEYFRPDFNEVKAMVAFYLPAEYSLNFHFKGNLEDLETKLELKIENININNVLIFKMPSVNEFMIKYTMRSNAVSMPFEASFNHKGRIDDFRTEFRMTNLWKENEDIVIRLIHRGRWTDFNTELTAEAGISHYRNILKFHFGGPGDITLAATAETPHAGYDRFGLDFKHNGMMQDFSSELKFTSPIRNYERALLVLVHKGRSEEFRSTLKLTTSHPSFPSVEVILDHRNSQSGLSNILKIVLPGDDTLESNLALNFESQIKYQATWSLKTPFEQYNFFSVALKHDTILGNNIVTEKTTIEIKTPFRDYREIKDETTKVTENDGRTVRSRRLVTMVPHRTFEENYYLNFGIMLSNAEFWYTLNSSEPWLNGYHISANYSSGATNELSGLLETPFYYLPNFSFKLHTEESTSSFSINYCRDSMDILLRHADDLKLKWVLRVPGIIGFSRITLTAEHRGQIDNFRTNLFFQNPDNELTISLHHKGHPRKFNTILTIDHNGNGETKTIKSELNVRLEDIINYQLMFSIDTPFSRFRNLLFNHGINFASYNHLAYLDVTFNDEKKFDVEYKNPIDGGSFSITMRSPYQVGSSVSLAGNSGSADINWDTTKPDKNVRFEFGLLTSVTSSRSSNGVNFTVITANYRAGFGIDLTIDESSLSHSLGMHWEKENDKGDFSYEIKGSKRERERSGEQTEGSLRVTTGSSIDAVVGFSHSVVGGSFYTTMYKEDKIANTQVVLKHNIDMAANTLTHTIKMEHPRFPKDIVLTTEVSVDRSVISLKQALQLNHDTYNLDASIRDDDSDGKNKVIGAIRAYHNPSALDLTMTGEWEDTNTETILIGSVSYKLSNTRETKKMTIQSVYNEEKEEIMIELKTPITSLTLRTENRQVDMDEGIFGYDIILESPDFFQFKTALDFSLPKRMLDFRFYTSEETYFQVLGQMKTFSEASVTLSRYDHETPEGDNSVNLGWSINEKSFLVSRYHVKPNFLQDWTRRMSPGVIESEATMMRIARSHMELKQLLDRDAAQKGARMRESIQPYGPAFREMREAVEEFMEEVEKMYNSNFLFIKDIVRGLRMLTEALRIQLRVCMAKTAAALRDYGRAVRQRMVEVNQKMAILWRSFVAQLEVAFKPHFDIVRQKIESYFRDLEVKLRAFLEDILTEPTMREIVEILKNLENMNFEQFQKLLVDSLDAFFRDRNIRDMIYSLAWLIEEYQDFLSIFVTRVQTTDLVNGLKVLASDSHISEKFTEAAEHFFKISENRWTVWDPRMGNYEFQVYLPPAIPALGDILIETDLNEIFDSIDDITDELSEMIEELTNLAEILHSSELTKEKFIELFPPFKAYASISGAQHYRTFDGKVYQFAGDCTYLLARDFSTKTFTVFVTYKKELKNGLPVKKSIGVTTDGRTFEIYPDGRVAVDGTKTELPYTFMDTTILRTGGNEIQLVNGNGFKLACDIAHDHCGLAVSGWYHGKLAGLFGINDFEPENDMMSSNNVKESIPEELASSWALGSRCDNGNTAITNEYSTSSRPYQICEALFGVSAFASALRPCFKTISPLDYRQMCLNSMPRPGENHIVNDKTPCKVAAAYVKDCRAHEVYVKMPKQCVQCGDIRARPGHYEGDTFQMTVESPDRIADLVFVMQSGQCNKRAFDKLKNLAEQLQKAFVESEGIPSIKYALVGYGGSYGSPRIHTLDSQIFNTFDKLNRVNFDTVSGSDTLIDGLNAIHYATKMPFRTGASKTIIFIPCNLCTEDGKSGLRFSDLHRTLVQSDIRLHVLLPELFKVMSSSPSTTKSAFIYGMDDQKAYTRRDVTGNALEGDAALRPFVKLPKDYCAALTHNTDGSVFSSKQWIETPVNIQKSFVDIFTRLVAKRAQPVVSQQCTCHADNVGMGVSQCSNSVKKHLLFWQFANFEDDEDVPMVPSRPVRPEGQGAQVTRHPQRVQHQTPRHRPTRPTRRPQQATF